MDKKILNGVFVLLMVFCGFSSHAANKIKLKMAVIVPKRSIWGKKLEIAINEIKEQTDGNVELKVFYGGVQGDELKVVQKMRIGQLHGAGFMARGMSKICPDSLVFAIPMLMHSDEEAIAIQAKMQDFFQKQARKRGFEVLGWSNQGFTYCFSKNKIDNLADLRKAKPWMLENDEFGKSFFKCSAIAGVPAQVGDVMTSLQSGMIHTIFSPPIGMIIMQWHNRVKYQMDLGLFYSFGAAVFTQKQWKKIPEKYQKVIRKVFQKSISELNEGIKTQNVEAQEVLSKSLKITTPSPEAIKEFRSITIKVEKDMNGKAFSPEAMILLKIHLKKYRAEKNK